MVAGESDVATRSLDLVGDDKAPATTSDSLIWTLYTQHFLPMAHIGYHASHEQFKPSEMFPNRFWLTVGSGQALNKHITGDKWLCKSDRNTRLKECADIIRAL